MVSLLHARRVHGRSAALEENQRQGVCVTVVMGLLKCKDGIVLEIVITFHVWQYLRRS